MFEASRKANAGRFWTCQSHMGERVLSVSLAGWSELHVGRSRMVS
jgi:hypothetical protein